MNIKYHEIFQNFTRNFLQMSFDTGFLEYNNVNLFYIEFSPLHAVEIPKFRKNTSFSELNTHSMTQIIARILSKMSFITNFFLLF